MSNLQRLGAAEAALQDGARILERVGPDRSRRTPTDDAPTAMPIDTIRIGRRHRRDRGDLEALAASIREVGLLQPIGVTIDGELVFGHRRLRACGEHLGWTEIPVRVVDVPSIGQGEYHENELRKAFTPSERVAILEAIERKPVGDQLRSQNFATADAAAKRAGFGNRETARQAQAVVATAPPNMVEAMDRGEVSISAAAKAIKVKPDPAKQAAWTPEDIKDVAREGASLKPRYKAIKRAQAERFATLVAAPIPVGPYSCIVIDPPWPMQKIERKVRPNQCGLDCPTMSEAELAALPIPAADDCHMFLWTTQRFFPMAQRLLEAWGFRHGCIFVWHKPGGFQPIGLPQYNCEFALYARRGTPKFVDTNAFPCCFEAPRREHSRKPDLFYDTVRRVTAGPRLEMFAREPREGFDCWGNECDKFAGAA